jgi:hypothetical protein
VSLPFSCGASCAARAAREPLVLVFFGGGARDVPKQGVWLGPSGGHWTDRAHADVWVRPGVQWEPARVWGVEGVV